MTNNKQTQNYPDLKMNQKLWIPWCYIMHFNHIRP